MWTSLLALAFVFGLLGGGFGFCGDSGPPGAGVGTWR